MTICEKAKQARSDTHSILYRCDITGKLCIDAENRTSECRTLELVNQRYCILSKPLNQGRAFDCLLYINVACYKPKDYARCERYKIHLAELERLAGR